MKWIAPVFGAVISACVTHSWFGHDFLLSYFGHLVTYLLGFVAGERFFLRKMKVRSHDAG